MPCKHRHRNAPPANPCSPTFTLAIYHFSHSSSNSLRCVARSTNTNKYIEAARGAYNRTRKVPPMFMQQNEHGWIECDYSLAHIKACVFFHHLLSPLCGAMHNAHTEKLFLNENSSDFVGGLALGSRKLQSNSPHLSYDIKQSISTIWRQLYS